MNKENTAYRLTEEGIRKCKEFIAGCEEKRKRILDTGVDTVRNVCIPDVWEIEKDVSDSKMIEGEYWGIWGVTDHYEADHILYLSLGTDFEESVRFLERGEEQER
jgi:hypothetical protein